MSFLSSTLNISSLVLIIPLFISVVRINPSYSLESTESIIPFIPVPSVMTVPEGDITGGI